MGRLYLVVSSLMWLLFGESLRLHLAKEKAKRNNSIILLIKMLNFLSKPKEKKLSFLANTKTNEQVFLSKKL